MLFEMHQKCPQCCFRFGEKADSVIAVKRNAEFNAAVNATYVTTSGCRIHRLANAALHIYCSNTNVTA